MAEAIHRPHACIRPSHPPRKPSIAPMHASALLIHPGTYSLPPYMHPPFPPTTATQCLPADWGPLAPKCWDVRTRLL